jgi:TolB-like protein/DNA-binding winged helix-turn-helix (wHTH) protein/Flp pilus assembly protein TadD
MASPIFGFSVFELDVRSGELRKSGTRVNLQQQPFQVLSCLLERPGELIARDELRQRLWPKDTFVDFEHGLNTAVKRLRDTLNDSADTPRFIETIPRRGYRFIAPVTRSGGVLDASAGPGEDSAIVQPAPAVQTRVMPGESRRPAEISAESGLEPPDASHRRDGLSAALTIVALGLVLALSLTWIGPEQVLGRRAGGAPVIRAIAVLPLENLSGHSDQDYLADGMTEAMIVRLGSLQNLRVISRTSVMQFKGTRKPVPEIAKALNVDAVVTGSVQRAGDRIRITAQLIRSDPEEQLWSDSYDRDLRDVLALQHDVAQVIALRVGGVVAGRQNAQFANVPRTVQAGVYDSYLKGRFQFNKYTRDSIEDSIRLFKAAIAGDATFAPAHVGLASAYSALGGIAISAAAPTDVRPIAVAAAMRALELDPTLADAHALLGSLKQQDWQWSEAEGRLRHALELNPSHARAHAALGWWLLCRGRAAEAIVSSGYARELDPLAEDLHVSYGITLYNARHHDEAVRELRSLLAINPNNTQALLILGLTLTASERFDEAIRTLELGASRSHRSPMMLGALAGAYGRDGQRARGLRIVDELISLRKANYVTAGAFVFAYMGLGEYEQGFAWLERGFAERTTIMAFIKVNPIYDPVRTDPRFMDLVRRVGLE